jgi:putative ABC transport system permease protein
MKYTKSFRLALNVFLHSKLRSWLTILGIVIGIAAVVSIVSISQGAQQDLEERLGSLGADTLTVSPGFSRAAGFGGGFRGGGFERGSSISFDQKNITKRDILTLKGVDNIKQVVGEISGSGEVSYSSKKSSLSIKGVDESLWKDITTEQLNQGRFLTKGDSFSVVLGGNIVTSTFEDGIPLNSQIFVEGKSFKVVGILEQGSTVYMPIIIARDILEEVGEEEFHTLSVKIENIELAEETVAAMEKKLMLSRGILKEKDKDFSIVNPADRQQTIQQTLGTMTLFLTAIAAISLLVGAVGIANTMFTSVLEKTKEIGIMKAIGAKNRDVLIIFLMNSGLIGLVGGIWGVILGVFGSSFVSSLGSGGGGFTNRLFGSTIVTPELIIFALVFSVLIGMIAGVIPAYRASKLNPVDALRYE